MHQGKFINRVMKITDTNQASLAKELGVTQGAVSQWTLDKTNPSAATLVDIHNICKGKLTLRQVLEGATGKKVRAF